MVTAERRPEKGDRRQGTGDRGPETATVERIPHKS